MKRIFLMSFLSLFAYLKGLTQDFSLFDKKTFTGSAGTLPYRILYPKAYDEKNVYPLVLLLHGAGERGNDNEKQLTWGASIFLNAEHRATFPCIVVIPQCPTNDYWASVKFERTHYPLDLDFNYTYPETTALKTAMELVEDITKRERVDKRRVYIVGLSMGGMGTFEAVFRHRDVFAAAIPICGGADLKAYTRRVAKIPFWIFHGEKDNVVPVKHSRNIYAKLKSFEAQVKYTEYPGVGHDSWVKAFADTDFIPWLFTNKR
ncbi:prolyl oligopeptidase family serine peptidase [Chryseolinea lacunae]|uniref:Prolyl oligopeptidase family serine peptidase n=1 Tax=Chryseolinea lacunae TaxID=2801331 RepID=A0ABS1KY76_9BACT|nr:prolyl oligopeptidase family serine peptidase [Chryseolinea lacunae]MBL0744354.1 prolyl oligopeptidase family serine peptidase [Chryseolinea lacunae]